MIKIHPALRSLKSCEVQILKFNNFTVYHLISQLVGKDMNANEIEYFKKHIEYFNVESASTTKTVYKSKLNENL